MYFICCVAGTGSEWQPSTTSGDTQGEHTMAWIVLDMNLLDIFSSCSDSDVQLGTLQLLQFQHNQERVMASYEYADLSLFAAW